MFLILFIFTILFLIFYDNNNIENFGKKNGDTKQFKCKDGHFITKIDGSAGKFLDSIKFTCSDGDLSDKYGGDSGTSYNATCATGFSKIGGRSGNWIDSLNFSSGCSKISNL